MAKVDVSVGNPSLLRPHPYSVLGLMLTGVNPSMGGMIGGEGKGISLPRSGGEMYWVNESDIESKKSFSELSSLPLRLYSNSKFP